MVVHLEEDAVKIGVIFFLAAGMIMVAAMVPAEQNRGAGDMLLFGGKSGDVPFPHHRHQKVIGNCNTCHAAFPQLSGIIEKLKDMEKLKKMQVMNEQCTRCHREKKNAGETGGPIRCNECHIK